MSNDARRTLGGARLYVLVADVPGGRGAVELAQLACAGGAQVIQLREKRDPDRVLYDKACAIAAITRSAGAVLVVNDRIDIAMAAGADGVHLGQEDLPIERARALWPTGIIGGSTHDDLEVERTLAAGADYLGMGCCFASDTKAGLALGGVDLVRRWTGRLSCPAFALGGITLERVDELRAAGATAVAVGAAVCRAADPAAAARELVARLS